MRLNVTMLNVLVFCGLATLGDGFQRMVYLRKPTLKCRTTLVLYALHLCILTKRSFVFPFQLIPNNHGLFLQIGYDSIAGMLSLAMFLRYDHNKRLKTDLNHDQNELSESPLPWHVPQKLKPKVTTVALILLTLYFASGLFAQTYDQILFALKTFGLPITDQMHMSLQVLLSHLTWVFMGVNILGTQLPDFFKRESTWYKARVGSNWMWWVCGGYFFSSWLFNCADCFNQLILPGSLFAVDEGVVSKLINPEVPHILSSLIGYIAPCISAPWWEEILYRGFMLPALSVLMPLKPAIIASGLVFSIHHLTLTGFLPLAVLGISWAGIYVASGNLVTTMIIHAMWNSRVFLGGWMGI
ncbi:hypothetical protein TrLO_g27 [Triparma laevis f. longispina]|uniref:CAAX prenyl protease 2/Lysostaphin resistance protein A-like domain-containing protein n=1 Tax=Triparma laevis f. longispina TaxID=1714387 RepID=A0A9W7F4W8_9STRA|nr:hypothetical protein TrLO_g27 [Triparma laevis f. longispina]